MEVGDTADISTHTVCGYYEGPPDYSIHDRHVIECEAVGRYLSIKRNGGGRDPRYLTLCEVIITGYVYNYDASG